KAAGYKNKTMRCMVLFLYAQTSAGKAAGLAGDSPHLQDCVSATRKCEQGGVPREAALREAAVCSERQRIDRERKFRLDKYCRI
ncbi:MAG: hypothetical protein Q4E64_10610, partial [Phascolarctobacterium sp.]|uniref:hypothetical protein n=1 Tax=Phascolarctobacterium sp. TaxID=2049039 RepID=UPI0026DB7E87